MPRNILHTKTKNIRIKCCIQQTYVCTLHTPSHTDVNPHFPFAKLNDAQQYLHFKDKPEEYSTFNIYKYLPAIQNSVCYVYMYIHAGAHVNKYLLYTTQTVI